MTAVKICGVRTSDVIQSLKPLSVTHVGFVFAKSKRQVTPQQAGQLIRELRAGADAAGRPAPLAVGVFVDPSLDELAAVLAEAPLDVVQLHGKESPELCAAVRERFGVQLFKAVSIARDSDAVPADADVAAQLDRYRGTVDAILLDTHDPVYGGGSGTTFAWDCIPPYRRWAREAGVQLLVAGGLTADNVASLVADYRPDGVDVSSGVETDGMKDIAKIQAFVERVASVDHTSA
ncbi:N-(5'-phosphoribosyl)anthranilate isomerase [Gordoniibacillus kamchatkensis]|uniref:N-(5'-phosphoribosyl)anthranilate isomerase n=1 Tax=Gordoniibacillus kamchatkensis TaxID=1590651 RepID=A0ABR5AKM0_9BACL|nr:phosphoribosylanthranilate isomerase [Paenibacillus sp. VKM B-2647]KIL41594.1 N-(5'-phosphoribosyl)anthranilate isomerase [Paenibacillus sp. VKM B-2647]